jgi:hypothetical protein
LEAFVCFLALNNSVFEPLFLTNLILLIMRKLILFSFIFMTFMSCNNRTTVDPVALVTLSISGKINCPSRTLTALNPSEYLITLVDSTGVTRETRPTADCKYSFDDLEMGHNYNIKIVRTVPSGGSTLSVTGLSNYFLNPGSRRSDLGLVAADVDKSGEIDETDLLFIRRVITGIAPNLPSGSFWFFQPSNRLTLSNNFVPNSNFGRWQIPNLTTSVTNYDFIQAQYSDIDLVRCN